VKLEVRHDNFPARPTLKGMPAKTPQKLAQALLSEMLD